MSLPCSPRRYRLLSAAAAVTPFTTQIGIHPTPFDSLLDPQVFQTLFHAPRRTASARPERRGTDNRKSRSGPRRPITSNAGDKAHVDVGGAGCGAGMGDEDGADLRIKERGQLAGRVDPPSLGLPGTCPPSYSYSLALTSVACSLPATSTGRQHYKRRFADANDDGRSPASHRSQARWRAAHYQANDVINAGSGHWARPSQGRDDDGKGACCVDEGLPLCSTPALCRWLLRSKIGGRSCIPYYVYLVCASLRSTMHCVAYVIV